MEDGSPVSAQPSRIVIVQRHMSAKPNWWLVLLCSVALSACANSEPLDRQVQSDTEDIWRALGCTQDEIAFCVGTNCRPDDYQCVDKGKVRSLF
jgi:hypothetical protein